MRYYNIRIYYQSVFSEPLILPRTHADLCLTPFSHKVWKSAYNYTENQACYIKLISPIYLTIFFFTVTETSLPLQSRLYRLIFGLYRYQIAYYLSHTGEDEKRFLLRISKC